MPSLTKVRKKVIETACSKAYRTAAKIILKNPANCGPTELDDVSFKHMVYLLMPRIYQRFKKAWESSSFKEISPQFPVTLTELFDYLDDSGFKS